MNRVINVGGRRGIVQRKTARKGSLLSRRRAATSTSPGTQRKKSKPELELCELLMQRGYRDFVCEATFHESRKWRIDFLWPLQRVGLEIEGGIFSRGRHVRPAGFIGDCEKYNAATLAGYRIYRIPVVKGWQNAAIAFVQREKLT
jgi:hypothetical protein